MSNLDLSRAVFRKSARSEGGNGCVEAATLDRHHLVRDSKNRSGPVLAFTHPEWAAFINGVKHNAFDPPNGRAGEAL
jgi:Domain of unknown function (DUF397)